METRRDAAKSLMQIGFAGLPAIQPEPSQAPQWLTEIWTLRHDTRLSVGTPSPVGEETERPPALLSQGIQGILPVVENTNYVYTPQRETVNIEAQGAEGIREVTRPTPPLGGNVNPVCVPSGELSAPEGYRFTGRVSRNGLREIEKIGERYGAFNASPKGCDKASHA